MQATPPAGDYGAYQARHWQVWQLGSGVNTLLRGHKGTLGEL